MTELSCDIIVLIIYLMLIWSSVLLDLKKTFDWISFPWAINQNDTRASSAIQMNRFLQIMLKLFPTLEVWWTNPKIGNLDIYGKKTLFLLLSAMHIQKYIIIPFLPALTFIHSQKICVLKKTVFLNGILHPFGILHYLQGVRRTWRTINRELWTGIEKELKIL